MKRLIFSFLVGGEIIISAFICAGSAIAGEVKFYSILEQRGYDPYAGLITVDHSNVEELI